MFKKIISIVLCVVFLTSILAVPASADIGDNYFVEQEYNDEMNYADLIYDDYTVSGTLTSYDLDYFRFNLAEPSTINITCMATYNTQYVLVVDNRDRAVAAVKVDDYNEGDYFGEISKTLPAGTYYVVMLDELGTYNEYLFYFEYTYEDSDIFYEVEYNDERNYADKIDSGYLVGGLLPKSDIDFFEFTLDGTKEVEVFCLSTTNSLSVMICGEDYVTAAQTTKITEDGNYYCDLVETIPAGKYYVLLTHDNEYCNEYLFAFGYKAANTHSHYYSNDCDTTCDGCGEIRTVTHTYSSPCDTICNVCHLSRIAPASHTYSSSCDAICNFCSEIRNEPHEYSSSCDTICNSCGAVRDASSAHTFASSCDATCNNCGETRIITHTYSSSCDASCNVCGLIRTTTSSHTYDNSCDTTCNNCGENRNTSHTYDSLCDTICNVCGATRTTSESHTYSYSCDATCDGCGDVRTDLVHTYDNECDNKCNDCDYERKAPHIYDDKKDLICNGCGYERPPYTPGDIDDSGEITLDDVVVLAQVIAGWQGVDHNAEALDVDGNGSVTLDDVVLLAQYVAGWAVTIK